MIPGWEICVFINLLAFVMQAHVVSPSSAQMGLKTLHGLSTGPVIVYEMHLARPTAQCMSASFSSCTIEKQNAQLFASPKIPFSKFYQKKKSAKEWISALATKENPTGSLRTRRPACTLNLLSRSPPRDRAQASGSTCSSGSPMSTKIENH